MEVGLNWLWQGTLLAAIVAIVIRPLGGMSAATRERIWWVTLLAVIAIPAFSLASSSAGPPPSSGASRHADGDRRRRSSLPGS